MLEGLLSIDSLAAVIDILIVAAVVYWLMLMIKGARAEKMIWGLGIIVIMYFVSQRAQLLTLNWILNNFLGSIVIIIVVVFQQDIRRALVHMGRPFSSTRMMMGKELLEEVSRAVMALSAQRTGALIVIERKTDLAGYTESGVDLDAKISRELLLSIFNPDSPVHDGAVVVRDYRVARAGVILPLTKKELGKSVGTRHRAAAGLAEETDAVVVVVSEKTGEVSVAIDDAIDTGFDYESLLLKLREGFVRPSASAGDGSAGVKRGGGR